VIETIKYYPEINLFIGDFIRSGRYGCVYDGVWKVDIPVAAKFFSKT
jgi:hypothetical protein